MRLKRGWSASERRERRTGNQRERRGKGERETGTTTLSRYRNREQRELIYFTSRTHTVSEFALALACTYTRLPHAARPVVFPWHGFIHALNSSGGFFPLPFARPPPLYHHRVLLVLLPLPLPSLPLTPYTLGRTETAEPCGVFWSWQLRWRCNNFNNDLSDLPSSPSLSLSLVGAYVRARFEAGKF